MKNLLSYEQRADMITTHAWERWTNNALHLDDDMRAQTTKTVQDAVANTYTDDISDIEWLTATLTALKATEIATQLIEDYGLSTVLDVATEFILNPQVAEEILARKSKANIDAHLTETSDEDNT